MASTALTGCEPDAVSADSITASVPSMTELATSSTSARVGIGLSTIDCSIWVAVITTLLHSSAVRMISFCRPGSSASPISTPEIAARHHHHIAGLGDFDQILDGLGTLDLGHDVRERAMAFGDGTGQFDIGGAAAERHGQEIDIQLGGDGDMFLVLLGQGIQRQAAAETVQAFAVRQRAAGQHRGDDGVAVQAQ